MDMDWWSFWDDETGFNLGKFEKAHEQVRHAQRRGARLRLKYLRCRGLQCLETNVFMNEGLGGYRAGKKVSCNPVLTALLMGIPRLKGVIAHGYVAQEYLRKFSLPANIQKYCMRPFRSESYKNLDGVLESILRTKYDDIFGDFDMTNTTEGVIALTPDGTDDWMPPEGYGFGWTARKVGDLYEIIEVRVEKTPMVSSDQPD